MSRKEKNLSLAPNLLTPIFQNLKTFNLVNSPCSVRNFVIAHTAGLSILTGDIVSKHSFKLCRLSEYF